MHGHIILLRLVQSSFFGHVCKAFGHLDGPMRITQLKIGHRVKFFLVRCPEYFRGCVYFFPMVLLAFRSINYAFIWWLFSFQIRVSLTGFHMEVMKSERHTSDSIHCALISILLDSTSANSPRTLLDLGLPRWVLVAVSVDATRWAFDG